LISPSASLSYAGFSPAAFTSAAFATPPPDDAIDFRRQLLPLAATLSFRHIFHADIAAISPPMPPLIRHISYAAFAIIFTAAIRFHIIFS
jgi:hypothetical protein